MTRLITEWIADMEKTAAQWDETLRRRTGLGYAELASRVSGNSVEAIRQASEELRVAVVPVTSGMGTIDTFSQSVAAISRAVGFETFVTVFPDVNGIYEACKEGADILFMADDDRYIALNIRSGKIGENNLATARGFVEALDALAGGLGGKEAAVLGYGIIGQLMAEALFQKGAMVSVFDKDPQKEESIRRDGYRPLSCAEQLKEFLYLADATSEGPWIDSGMLNREALVAAPGIPFSLDEKARARMEGRYIHDLLEIGTAVMLGMAI